MTSELTVIIPVYNEAANFPRLWQALTTTIRSPFSVIVVYDFEEDNTLPVLKEILAQGEQRLKLVRNSHGASVAGAIRTGFEQVLEGPVLVVMADLCDDLSQVGKMLELYRRGYHVVAGSRYIKDGGIVNGPWLKQGLSRLAGLSLYWLRSIPTHDASNAFKIYDAAMLRTLNLESARGFEINLEITVKAFLAGYKITEIPTVWRERTEGKSNFKLWSWLPLYMRWFLYAFQPKTHILNPQR